MSTTLSEIDESLLAIAHKGNREVLYLLTTRLRQLRSLGRDEEAVQVAIKINDLLAHATDQRNVASK